jgi:hypothetical protein
VRVFTFSINLFFIVFVAAFFSCGKEPSTTETRNTNGQNKRPDSIRYVISNPNNSKSYSSTYSIKYLNDTSLAIKEIIRIDSSFDEIPGIVAIYYNQKNIAYDNFQRVSNITSIAKWKHAYGPNLGSFVIGSNFIENYKLDITYRNSQSDFPEKFILNSFRDSSHTSISTQHIYSATQSSSVEYYKNNTYYAFYGWADSVVIHDGDFTFWNFMNYGSLNLFGGDINRHVLHLNPEKQTTFYRVYVRRGLGTLPTWERKIHMQHNNEFSRIIQALSSGKPSNIYPVYRILDSHFELTKHHLRTGFPNMLKNMSLSAQDSVYGHNFNGTITLVEHTNMVGSFTVDGQGRLSKVEKQNRYNNLQNSARPPGEWRYNETFYFFYK